MSVSRRTIVRSLIASAVALAIGPSVSLAASSRRIGAGWLGGAVDRLWVKAEHKVVFRHATWIGCDPTSPAWVRWRSSARHRTRQNLARSRYSRCLTRLCRTSVAILPLPCNGLQPGAGVCPPDAPDEIAALAAHIMGSEGGFITGSDFLIDGGATANFFYGSDAGK